MESNGSGNTIYKQVEIYLQNVYSFLTSRTRDRTNYCDDDAMNTIKASLMRLFPFRNNIYKIKVLNFNDELFRCYCQLYFCTEAIRNLPVLEKWGKQTDQFLYYTPLTTTSLELSCAVCSHLYLLQPDEEMKEYQPIWPTQDEIQHLLSKVCVIQQFYFWKSVEQTQLAMQTLEDAFHIEDEKKFEEAETKRVAVHRKGHNPNENDNMMDMEGDEIDEKDPLNRVRKKIKTRQRYVKSYPFTNNVNKPKRMQYIYNAGHEQSGFLFRFDAKTICNRFIPYSTYVFTQIWCEEDLYNRYETELLPLDQTKKPNIHKWLQDELGYAQPDSIIDKARELMCEYALPIGGRMWCQRISNSTMASDILLNELCGASVATKAVSLITETSIHEIAKNVTHPLYDIILLVKMDHVWNSAFGLPDVLDKHDEDGGEETDTNGEKADWPIDTRDDVTGLIRGKSNSFSDKFIIPYNTLLHHQTCFEAEKEWESTESLKARGIPFTEHTEWATAQRLPYIVWLKRKWMIHHNKKWRGEYDNLTDALLCWMSIIKDQYLFRLPDRTSLEEVYQGWFVVV